MKKVNAIFKCALAGMLSTVLFTSSAMALDMDTPKVKMSESEYIASVAPDLLAAIGADCDKEYTLSNSFDIWNVDGSDTNRNICFIICNGKIVGDMTIGVDETGKYSASAGFMSYNEVGDAYNEKTCVTFFCQNEALIMQSENSNKVIFTAVESSIKKDNVLQIKAIKEKKQIISTFKVQASSSKGTINYQTGAAIVGQGNIGTCWAASVASKVMYETSYNSLTADIVHQKVCDVYGNIGTKRERCRRGMAVYGLTMDESFTGIKAFNVLRQKTQTGNLVILRLENVNNASLKHVVVLSGYAVQTSNSGSGSYSLMDPNYNTTRSVTITSVVFNGTAGFVYYSAIGSYAWIDSVCTQ